MPARTRPTRINLALQGGGAHGAFTWGVLDRLLEDDRIEIAAISGTSAGALNGAAVKSGFARPGGGPEAAREVLDWLWTRIGSLDHIPALTPWLSAFPAEAISKAIEYSPFFAVSDTLGRMVSPYDSGPFYRNPLTPIVEELHYDEVCSLDGPELHVCATNVRTGKVRVFTGDALGPDVLLASACLPTLFRAVEIHDPDTGRTEAYWDGGYTGNPALFPLFGQHLPNDVVIVNINPLYREEVPTTARDIQNRINEISFNSSLLRELRAIQFVKELIAEGKVPAGAMKDVFVHMIAADDLMVKLSVATKLMPNPAVLAQLKAAGRAAAEAFLDSEAQNLGKGGTVDLPQTFGGRVRQVFRRCART